MYDDTEEYIQYIYTDIVDKTIITNLEKELYNVKFIVRDLENWDIRYITNILTDPNLKVLVINQISEMSIAEITLASFMCKTILCTTKTILEYDYIYDMITDLQEGCNLTINNNSFKHWYESRG